MPYGPGGSGVYNRRPAASVTASRDELRECQETARGLRVGDRPGQFVHRPGHPVGRLDLGPVAAPARSTASTVRSNSPSS